MLRTVLPAVLLLSACADGVSSDDEAALAYTGLDDAVERALRLGLQGFDAADSANIPTQQEDGDVSGTMTVSGQVDQGASDNKGLRLDVVLVDYADRVDVDPDDDEEVVLTYDTVADAPAALDLQLRDVPDGTFTGTLLGDFVVSGDLDGQVTLDLTLSGDLEPDGDGGVRRAAGTTTVVGTATNDRGGTFDVDVVR